MCRDPVTWETPTGKEVKVNLSLNFGTFFGYTQEDGEDVTSLDNGSQSYLGTECHGVMWTADTDLPHGWPVAPPIVAGKVMPERNTGLRACSSWIKACMNQTPRKSSLSTLLESPLYL